jgi:simple sugar transport system permease protein
MKGGPQNSTAGFVKAVRWLYSHRSMGILTILVGMSLFFYLFTPKHRFGDILNLNSIMRITPELGIVALGATILMLAGEFDLSVGSIFAFGGLMMSMANTWWQIGPVAGFLLGIVATGLIGGLNGLIVTKTKIPSFVVTLGTSMVWRGVILYVSRGTPILFRVDESAPAFFNAIVGEMGWFPIQMLWFVLATALLWVVIERSRFGNWVSATGGNPSAAQAMGINTDTVKILCWIILGVLCGIGGMVEVTRVRQLSAEMGGGLGLETIAAYSIGGTSLAGGVGTVIGTFAGMLLIRVIESGLLILRVEAYTFQAFIGAMLVVGVMFNLMIDKWRRR